MLFNKTIGSIFIISGTCIGAGMLALPISTATSGFMSSVFLLITCWVLMYFTGLLVLEVNLRLPVGANFVSMAYATLGNWGRAITWLTYLMLLFSLMAAYETGGGELINSLLNTALHTQLPHWTGDIVMVLLFGTIVYTGTTCSDYINRILIIGLAISYALLLVFLSPHIKPSQLWVGHVKYLLAAAPILFTSFGYHITIPTLRRYLDSDLKKLKKIILFGSALPLIVYLLWEMIIFGIIPLLGPHSLNTIMVSGHASTGITDSLNYILQNSWLAHIVGFFGFFALTTSFLGVSLSLFDCLMDGLKLPRNHKGKVISAFLCFIPPLIFAIIYPKGFIAALAYAGTMVAILHGIIPALMAWVSRHSHITGYRAPGGSLAILIVIAASSVIIYAEIAAKMHWITGVG